MTDNANHLPPPYDQVRFLPDGHVVVVNPDKPPLVIDGERTWEVTP